MAPIDPVAMALSIGATFVARSFSGDKEQLVPILKTALAHRGLALVDVVSPCVTFNEVLQQKCSSNRTIRAVIPSRFRVVRVSGRTKAGRSRAPHELEPS